MNRINRELEQNARLTVDDRPVQDGDIAVINMKDLLTEYRLKEAKGRTTRCPSAPAPYRQF